MDISPEKGVQLAGYPHCPRPNEGVHDPLYATCMYLDNGDVKHAFVTCDLLYFAKPYVKELRSKFDFTITVTVSHTHSGPWVSKLHEYEEAEGVHNSPEYISEFMKKLHLWIGSESSIIDMVISNFTQPFLFVIICIKSDDLFLSSYSPNFI